MMQMEDEVKISQENILFLEAEAAALRYTNKSDETTVNLVYFTLGLFYQCFINKICQTFAKKFYKSNWGFRSVESDIVSDVSCTTVLSLSLLSESVYVSLEILTFRVSSNGNKQISFSPPRRQTFFSGKNKFQSEPIMPACLSETVNDVCAKYYLLFFCL